MLVSCSTVENCAIWAMNCELSVGLVGSCIFSCATRIFRNVSLSSALAFLLSSVAALVPSVPVIVIGSAMALGADVDERPGGELDRAGRGGHGRLVGVVLVFGAVAAGAAERVLATLGAALVVRCAGLGVGRQPEVQAAEVDPAGLQRALEIGRGPLQQRQGLGAV